MGTHIQTYHGNSYQEFWDNYYACTCLIRHPVNEYEREQAEEVLRNGTRFQMLIAAQALSQCPSRKQIKETLMDPNAALEAIRNIITQHYGGIARASDYEELTDLVAGLDNWMSMGGFMPAPWQESRPGHWQEVLASTNAKAYDAGVNEARNNE